MERILSFISREPTAFLFRKVWHFSAGNRHNVVLFLILFVFSNLTALLGPLVFGWFLNEIQRNGITSSNITHLLLILSLIPGLTLLFWFFHGIGRIIERKNSFYVKLAYREYLLRGVLDLGLAWHTSRDSGDTIDKINKATDGLNRFADQIFVAMEILIRIIGTAIVLYFFNAYIGLFVLPCVVAVFFLLSRFDKRLVKQYKTLNLLDNQISAKIFDALSNVTSIIILDVRSPILRNIKRVMLYPKQIYEKNVITNEGKWFTGAVFFDLLVAVPLAFYVLYLFRNNIVVEIGTISTLYLYLGRMSEMFFSFGGFYEKIIVSKTSVQNVESIEESFEKNSIHRQAAHPYNRLAVTDVNFSYGDMDSGAKHLNDVSLELVHGEKIALIGESGSGKTTLLKVLHGLYPSARGQVSLDGGVPRATNFADIDFNTMLVPQEPELFSASILENITFGVDYSPEEINEAVSLAQFSDVVDLLPRGMKSVVNEKGVNLSGGQKQRLALARALLFARNKDIILLDESTSSVDPANEAKIYENIFAKFENKIILASIHKMNLLKYFDRIIMFENGEIVDGGTFDELFHRNEAFKESWNTFITSSD